MLWLKLIHFSKTATRYINSSHSWIIYIVPTMKWEPLIQLLQNLVGKPPISYFPTG